MASAVLDASAILAVLNGEAGAESVIAVLDDAVISTVNYAEVISKLVERGAPFTKTREALQRFGIGVINFDLALAERAGELRLETKRLGLSLADRACLALAERERAPAFTSDRRWTGVTFDVEVHLIR